MLNAAKTNMADECNFSYMQRNMRLREPHMIKTVYGRKHAHAL